MCQISVYGTTGLLAHFVMYKSGFIAFSFTCDKDKYILWLLVSGPISKWTFEFIIVIVCSVARNGISFVTACLIYMYEDVDFMEFAYVL